ncbi:hypothetical protein HDV57DRAFT_498681 [Trichoderma longibrachiatum]|uniref:Uncharacterized protein n=1 Tax=Trichoderma longibrachiatum ATCC 18648 TaxID=983965 RepID=A0A2T4BSS1_TRILO|nr:hypothetical protein M440DRAFT_1342081 [Trichoderma longibrachiatum ATCC 18648]
MAKRKSSDPLPPPKRTRLSQARDTLDSEPSLRKGTRREKRKRLEPLPSDSHEEPKPKRARTSTDSSDATTDSLNISAEPWPSIEDVSEEEEIPAFTSGDTTASRESSFDRWPSIPYEPKSSEETDLEVLAFQIAGEGHVCDCEHHLLRRYGSAYPILSPDPSDDDASEIEDIRDIEHALADESIPWSRHSTIKPHPMPSPRLSKASPRRRRSVTPYRRIEKCSSPPSREEEPQQQGRKNRKNKRRQPRKETHSPAVKNFLRSKRSSRRAPAGQLWCLDDKGTAREVASTRR